MFLNLTTILWLSLVMTIAQIKTLSFQNPIQAPSIAEWSSIHNDFYDHHHFSASVITNLTQNGL